MGDFTVNTDILIIASGAKDADQDDIDTCAGLLHEMQETDGVQLVLEKAIVREYWDKLSEPSFGFFFLQKMLAQEGKIHWVSRATGHKWKPVRVALDGLGKGRGIHQEDRRFVRVAMVSDDKRIVAKEQHFHRTPVQKVLKDKANVVVLHASEARDQI